MNAVLAAFVNGAIASALTALVLWLVLAAIPRHALNAATRYAVWWVAMAVTISLPLLFLPVRVPAPSRPAPVMAVSPSPRPVTPAAPLLLEPRPSRRAVTTTSSRPSSHMPSFPIEVPAGRWPRWLFIAWFMAAGALLLRLAVSIVLLYRLRSRAFNVSGKLGDCIEQWMRDYTSSRRAVRLIASRDIATPVAIGPWRPSILIPAALLEELDAAELTQIGLHEGAHFVRRDDYALLLERILEALFALHPVVRWIARRIDLEREIACDDLVISSTGNPVSYAACLIRVVELSGGVRSSLAAAAATEDSSHLSRRINLLLDKTRHTGTLLLKLRLVEMIAVVALLALASGRVSTLVAFAQPFMPHSSAKQIFRPAQVTLLPQQASTRADQPEDPAGYDLTGQVLEDSSSSPLASAELRFHKTGMRELAADLETDRQGRFHAPGLPPGDYTVEALKPNFVPTTFKLRVPSGNPLIRMVRFGVIDGQAMDAQGKPLPGRILDYGRTIGSTRITVLMKAPGSEELRTFREIPVEDAGHYRVYDLPPGEYVLGIWYSGLNDGSGMQLYPDNSHPRMFTVMGGEEYSNINFVVVARPSWRVSGKVAIPEGVKAPFQLALGLPDQPTLPIGMTLSEKDGSFHFEKIPAGTYDLFVAGPTGGYSSFESILGRGDPYFGRTRVNVGGQNLEDVSISVGAGKPVKLLLRGVGTEGVPEGCPQKANVTLASLEPWGTRFMTSGQAEFGKEQTVNALAPGRFRVEARDLGPGCFQVNRPVVDLSADVAAPVAIEVASAGSIHGSLPGGGAYAVVLLPAAGTDGAEARFATPDANGRFGFEGLPPGRYRISVQAADASGRSRWVSAQGGREVDVAGGGPTSVQLSAPPTEGTHP